MSRRRSLLLALLLLILFTGCAQKPEPAAKQTTSNLARYQPVPYVKIVHPDWSKNASIYQINTRQFTPEGTFRAAELQLPRLQALGVKILWLMPIHPIGQKNRKGTLGSPYSVQDYLKVNPELGTLDDLKHFVAAAHQRHMYVILDWVANHTAWDNVLVTQHPEWYARNWKGDFRPTPWWDWSDIIDLDYSHPELRKYMTDALKYWVREADIDGYRCDVAGYVPVDFWNNARKELEVIKPVFMLAEWEARDLHEYAFDMTYAWTWYDGVRELTTGRRHDLGGLRNYYAWNESYYPHDIMRMTFVSNHDKNSWDGTEFEQFGAGLNAAIVLSCVGEGMPLVYNGQEAGNRKRLKFFEKDPIVWKHDREGDLYQKLIALKTKNTALWNAHWSARMVDVTNSAPNAVFSFVRQNDKDKVFTVINFSAKPQNVTFKDNLYHGSYIEYLSGTAAQLGPSSKVTLKPWESKIFVK